MQRTLRSSLEFLSGISVTAFRDFILPAGLATAHVGSLKLGVS